MSRVCWDAAELYAASFHSFEAGELLTQIPDLNDEKYMIIHF